MAYSPYYGDWKDDPDHTTPIVAAALDNMEAGIGGAHTLIASLDTRLTTEEAQPNIPAVVDGQWLRGSGGALIYDAIDISEVTGLQAALDGKAAQSALDSHMADPIDAHDAAAISFVPTGTIDSSDVQAAIAEVSGDIVAGGLPGTIIDAKGDLIVGTAPDTPDRLAVGADGQVLTADTAQAGGLRWATPAVSGPDATKVDKDASEIASARLVANKLLASDAQPAIRINGDGRHEFGPGGATVADLFLYRGAASALYLGTTSKKGSLRSYGQSASDTLVEGLVTTDGYVRALLRVDGQMQWGPGNNPLDTNLYRSAASILKSDDKLDPAAFNVPTKAGVPVDGDIVGGAQDGDMVVDTTGRITYVRIGGTWQSVGGGAAIDPAIFDAKGDLLGASAADAPVRVPVGTNGQALLADSTQASGLRWGAVAASGPPLVIALPGSPVDGDEIIFTDSLTAPTYTWHLKYVNAKASNKWVFIGGAPVVVSIVGQDNVTSVSYVDAGTVGPSFTVPVAGSYLFNLVFQGSNATAGASIFGALKVGAATASDDNCAAGVSPVANNVICSSRHGAVAAAAADILKMQYRVSAGTGSFLRRTLSIVPQAVGG